MSSGCEPNRKSVILLIECEKIFWLTLKDIKFNRSAEVLSFCSESIGEDEGLMKFNFDTQSPVSGDSEGS